MCTADTKIIAYIKCPLPIFQQKTAELLVVFNPPHEYCTQKKSLLISMVIVWMLIKEEEKEFELVREKYIKIILKSDWRQAFHQCK